MTRKSALVLASSIAALLAGQPARATILYWDLNGATANTAVALTGAWNGTNLFWNTVTNGTGGTPQAGTTSADDLFFSSQTTGFLYTTGTVTLSGTRAAHSISFRDNVTTTLTGGTSLTIGSATAGSGIFGVSGANAATTIATPLILSGGASIFSNAGLGVMSFTGGITGAQNLTLNNNAATTNGITVSGASLNNTGTLTNSGTGGGATLVSASIGSSVTTVTQNSASSSLSLSGTNAYTGSTTVTAGALSFRNTSAKPVTSAVTVAANATLALGISGAGAFTAADVDSLFTGTLAGVANDATSLVGIDTTGGDASYTSTVPTTRGLAKLGANVLTLTIGAGSYTGPTAVNAGVLFLTGNNNAVPGTTTVTATGTLRVNDDTNFTGGTLALAGNATNTATLDLRNDAATTLTKNVVLNGASTSLNTINVDQAVGGTGTNNVHTINTITQATAAIRPVTVTGANGYGLTIGNFNLSPGTGQASTVTANVNVTLSDVTNPMSGFGASNFDTLTLSGTSTGSSVTGVIEDAVGGSATAGGYTRIIKSGTGTWTLASNNIHSGKTFINQGTLNVATVNSVNVGGSSSLGAPSTVAFGTIDIGATTTAGILNYTGNANETTDRVINLAGTTGGATLTQSGAGALKFTSAFTATGVGAKTLTLSGSAGTGEIVGAIVNGSGTTALTKSGTGIWTLAGANAYTGATTVSGGSLALSASGTTGATLSTSAVTVNSSGIFAIRPGVTTTSNNLIGSTLTMNPGSAFSMTDGFTNTFNVIGATNLYAGTAGTVPSYSFDISGTNSISDVLAISGVLSSTNTGALISVAPLAPLTVGNTYTIITAGSGLNTAGLTPASAGRTSFGNTAYLFTLTNNPTSTVVTITSSGAAFAYYTGGQGTTLNATAGPATNWATDVGGGTDAAVQPNYFTDVFFSAGTAANLTVATLGKDYVFNTLNFNNAAASAAINDTASNTVTVNGGINMTAGSQAAAVNVPVIMGAVQTWTNNGLNPLTLTGAVTNGGFLLTTAGTGNTTIGGAIGGIGGLTKTENGTLTLGGGNTYSGPTTVSAGTLVLSGSSTTSTIVLNGGTGTTVRVTNPAATGAGAINMVTGVTNASLQLYIDGGGTIALPNYLSGNSGVTTNFDVNNNGSGTNGVIQFTGSLGSSAIGNATFNVTGGNGYSLRIDNLRNTGGSAASLLLNPTTASLSVGNLTVGSAGVAGTYILGLGGTNTANFVTGVISNSTNGISFHGVTKSNTGTWTLSGANTYTGATTISGGTLKAGSAVAFTGLGTLSMSATGIFDLSGNNVGFTNIAASATTDTITNSGNADATLTASSLTTLVSALLTDGPTNKLAVTLSNANSGNNLFKLDSPNTFSGGITLTGGTGAGTRMRIWSGTAGTPGVIVNGGTAGAIVSSPFGTGPITLGLNSADKGGIMFNDLAPTSTVLNEFVFNTTLGNDNRGIRVENTATGLTLAGKITANQSNAVFTGANGAILNLTGKITGANGLETNNINSNLIVVLNNTADNNDYAGDTIVGYSSISLISTLSLGRANQIPNGTGKGNVTVNGMLTLGGFSETINGLNGNSTGTVDGVSGTPTLTVGDNDATGAFSGVIKNTAGTLALTKTGTGTQTLSGSNTYGGATAVNGGTLILSGANTGAGVIRGVVTIASGATLQLASANALGYTAGVRVDTVNINGGILHDVVNGDQGFNQTYNLTGGTMRANGGTSDATASQWYAFGPGTAVNTLASATTSTIEGRLIMRSDSGNTNTTFTVADGAASTDLLISAAVTKSELQPQAVGITKAGAGLMQVTGGNTYIGVTNIAQGTLSAASIEVSGGASNLGNATSAVVLGDATNKGTLSYTGSSVSYTRGFTVNAGGGEIDTTTSGQTLSISGAITSATDTSLTIGGAGNTTIATAVALGATTGLLTKSGAGVLNIDSGAQTYATLTTTAGAGVTNVSTAIGTGTTVNANSTMNFYASQTLGALNIAAGVEVTFGDGLQFAGGPEKLGGSAVVPEPGSLGLLVVGALGLACRRRRA